MYALPGGFVDVGETAEDACCRELKEETGVEVFPDDLGLVGVYLEPKRDPRGHTCSVAFVAQIPGATPKAGDDAAAAEWIEDWTEVDIAFDHARIIADALKYEASGALKAALPNAAPML